MKSIVAFCLVLVTVQALPSEFLQDDFEAELLFDDGFPDFRPTFLQHLEQIKTTQDIIAKLKSIDVPQEVQSQVDFVIGVLSMPQVALVVDGVLADYPELPSIVRGIRIFLTGPEAAPFISALKKFVGPVLQAITVLYREIELQLEKAGEVITEQGVRLFFRLQQPDVIEVLQKFQRLPEVATLHKYAKQYGIDVLGGLKDLEERLSTGISIPTH